jgi:hypothetical protein
MIWASKKGLTLGLALVIGLAGTALAGPVVVRSTGPSAKAYPAGRQLADNAQLPLKAGDSLVLLDARGTRTISGPGTFPAISTGVRAGTTQTAARILANQSKSERRGGAVRGGGQSAEARSPNLWFVDVSKSGTVCVADPKAIRFWRASPAAAGEVTVSGAGATGAIALPPGASVADWPKSVPVTEGGDYVVTLSGAAPTKIRIVTVPVPADLEDTAIKLIAKGCKTQLDLLIATTSANGDVG